MVQLEKPAFNAAAFLAHAGLGRKVVQVVPRETFFSQGDPADSVFYLQDGRAKITVVSQTGKEATVALLSAGDFVGEESLAAAHGLRLATTKAITACTALKISREEMIRVMHEEHEFSDLFLKFLLARSMRTQADLVDQLFNSSEKRLARILLLMAEFGRPSEPQTLIPKISQETLAEMIGTTRSRVSFFMNRFRKLGFIEYDGRIRVHRSLLNVVLHDQLPGDVTEELTGEASAAAGPVGRHASAGTDWKMDTEALSYSRTKGLFVGVAVDGAVIQQDNDSTVAFYGKTVSFRESLSGGVRAPRAATHFLMRLGLLSTRRTSTKLPKRNSQILRHVTPLTSGTMWRSFIIIRHSASAAPREPAWCAGATPSPIQAALRNSIQSLPIYAYPVTLS